MPETKPTRYARLAAELRRLLETEHDFTANAANLAALLYHTLPDINWAGLYINRHGVLVLGPFQGKPACARIPLGKGVCGTSAHRQEAITVPDVRRFPGHIACDIASQSEIVIPLIENGRVIGVLDLDSPELSHFDSEDRAGLEQLVQIFLDKTETPD